VVVDPWALLAEIEALGKQGVAVTPGNLLLADNAALILPLHGALDRLRESARGEASLGTTGRGIGPAYEDKAARRAIRVCDLFEPATLARKLDELLPHHEALLRGRGVGAVGYVLGITKAYTTRVGAGPFPTELNDAAGLRLGERGHEFGTVTGRKRRCGWFDATLVRQAVKVGGIDGIALTKLDVLDG